MKYKISQPLAIHELGQRANQEDSLFPAMGQATTDDRLFLVCDGMGGHEKGEVASQTICQVMPQVIQQLLSEGGILTDDMLQQAMQAVYQRLDELDNGGSKRMGSTLTLLCLHRGGCTVAYMGDSRIYHLRPATDEVRFRSKDHSQVYDLFAIGEITYDEISTAQGKNIITRAVMPGEENRSKIDIVHIADVKPGDYFYLCSDGMLEQMNDDELMDIVSSIASNEEKRNRLVAATQENRDNHSAYLIHIDEVVNELVDNNLIDDEQTSMSNELVFKRHILSTVEPPAANDEEVDVVTIVPTEPKATPPDFNPKSQSKKEHEVADKSAPKPTTIQKPQRKSKIHKWLPVLLAVLIAAGICAKCCKKDKPVTQQPKTEQQDSSKATKDPRIQKIETEFQADKSSLDNWYSREMSKANNNRQLMEKIETEYKENLNNLKQQREEQLRQIQKNKQ